MAWESWGNWDNFVLIDLKCCCKCRSSGKVKTVVSWGSAFCLYSNVMVAVKFCPVEMNKPSNLVVIYPNKVSLNWFGVSYIGFFSPLISVILVVSPGKLWVSQNYHCECVTECKSEKKKLLLLISCLIALNNEVTFHFFKKGKIFF